MKDDYRVAIEYTDSNYLARRYEIVTAGKSAILSWGTQGWAYFHQLAVF